MKTAHHIPGALRSRALALVAVAPLIVACGSSSATRSATAVAGNSASSARNALTTATLGHSAVSKGEIVHRPTKGTGGNEVNDENPGGADAGKGHASGERNPCTLVSRAQAQTILGKPIAAPQEAPLGPTCIYQPLGATSTVTVVVETIAFAKISSQIRGRKRVTVAGRTAYCGDLGRPTTFVPLSGGRVLSVAAPCNIGTQFAEKALPRLGSTA